MGRKNQNLNLALTNQLVYNHYYSRLLNLAISRFKWENLPSTIDERFLEKTLLENGTITFFVDEIMGALALPYIDYGKPNNYGNPTVWTAFGAPTNYRYLCNPSNAVICYDNMLHSPNTITMLRYFAMKLANISRTMDVNLNGQKTPVLITCTEQQRLTLENFYQKYEGNAPVIYGDKNIDLKSINVFKTDAPYLQDKLHDELRQTWADALAFLGIAGMPTTKKERMISSEVDAEQGGVVASRFTYISERERCCTALNELFGWNVSVRYQGYIQLGDEPNSEMEEIE